MGKNIWLNIYKNSRFINGISEILEQILEAYENYIKFFPRKYLQFDDFGNIDYLTACDCFFLEFSERDGVGTISSSPKIFDENIVDRILEFWEAISRKYFFEEIVIIDCQESDFFDEGKVFYYHRGELYHIDDFGIIDLFYIRDVIKRYDVPILSKEEIIEKKKQEKKEKMKREKEEKERWKKRRIELSEYFNSLQSQNKIKLINEKQKYINLAEDLKDIRDILKNKRYLENSNNSLSSFDNITEEHQRELTTFFNKIKMSNKKIILAGDGGVGKLTFLYRLTTGKYSPNTKMTIGVECLTKTVVVNKKKINFCFWTLGGQERFRFFLPLLCRGLDAAILMFDLTRAMSLERIPEWVNICRKENPNLPILFLRSKADLADDIDISKDYIMSYKEQFNLYDYLKISSKTGENVEEAFNMLLHDILGIL